MTVRKRHVTMTLRDEDLERLDAYAARFRVSRGDAVGLLMSAFAVDTAHRDWHQELHPDTIAPGRVVDPHVGTGDPTAPAARPWSPESELPPPLPLIRTPEEKAAALALLRPLVAKLPDTKGIHEPNRQPDAGKDWDE